MKISVKIFGLYHTFVLSLQYQNNTNNLKQNIMTTQTFQERINDTNKTPIAAGFISKIRSIASLSNKSEDEIYQMWVAHCEWSKNADQSPLLSEFCEWNNLPVVE